VVREELIWSKAQGNLLLTILIPAQGNLLLTILSSRSVIEWYTMDRKVKYSDEPPREGPPPDDPNHIEERQCGGIRLLRM